jgi:hypothetical protein
MGFEPMTSSAQGWRATSLRYTPITVDLGYNMRTKPMASALSWPDWIKKYILVEGMLIMYPSANTIKGNTALCNK